MIVSLLIGVEPQLYAQKRAKKNKKSLNIKQKKLSDDDKRKFDFLFGEAMRYKLVHEFGAAELHLKQCVKIDPAQAAPYFELSNIYYHFHKDLEAATMNAKAAAEIDPSNFWYQVHYAECLYEIGNREESIKVYRQMTSTFPEKHWIGLQLAKILGQDGQFAECIKVCDQIEQNGYFDEDVISLKVYAYVKLGKAEKAIAEQRRLIKRYPEENRYYFQLAGLYMDDGQKEKAMEVFEELLKVKPNDGYLHLELAQFYYRNGNREKVGESLKKAFEDPELEIDAKVKILLSYYDAVNLSDKFKSEAFELCEIIVRVHPRAAVAHTIYADFLYSDKQLKKAKYHFSRAVELDESRFPIWSQLILMDMELNAFDSVQYRCEQAQELFPNQPSLYYFDGIASLQLKEYDRAIKVLNTGLKLVVDNESIKFQFYVSLGDAYHEKEMHKESDASFENALAIDSGNPNVLNNYSYYLCLREVQLDRAERMSARSNKLAPNQPSYLDTYAWIMYKMKRYEEARTWIEKALLFGGDQSAEVLEHAGDIYYQLKKVDEAVGYWQKAKTAATEPSPALDKKIQDKVLYE